MPLDGSSRNHIRGLKQLDAHSQLVRKLEHIGKSSQAVKNLTPYRPQNLEYLYGYQSRRPKYLIRDMSNINSLKKFIPSSNKGGGLSLPHIQNSSSPRINRDVIEESFESLERANLNSVSTLSHKKGGQKYSLQPGHHHQNIFSTQQNDPVNVQRVSLVEPLYRPNHMRKAQRELELVSGLEQAKIKYRAN